MAELSALQTPGQTLFGRSYELTVLGTRWTGTRIQFKVNKSLKPNPNPCEIQVSNLNAISRGLFTDRGTPLQLRAGYQSTLGLLFTGQIVAYESPREPLERISKITCRDGDPAWLTYTSHSWGVGVPRLTVMQTLASDLGYSLSSDAQALVAQYGSTRGPLLTHGHTWQAISTVLTPLGLGWSIQDGEFQIVPGGSSTAEPAILLTPRTGLIGVPEYMEQYHKPNSKKKGKLAMVRARSLLQIAIKPGRQVRIECDTMRGNFVCQTVEHAGDTHGADWQSTCELQEIQ